MSTATSKYRFEILGSDKTKKTFMSIRRNLDGLADKAAKFGGAAFAGVAVGAAALVKGTLNANVEMIRLAESTGVSTRAMSEWSYAAKTVNISSEKMADIFKDAQEKIGDFAATGGGEAKDVIKGLKLDVEELIKLSPDQQLLKIAEGLEKVGSQAEKSFYLESLANDATYLLPLLDNNAEKLRDLQQEARDLGVSISEIDATKMKVAQRSLERITGLWQGFANTLTIEVSPIIEAISEDFIGVAKNSTDMGEKIRGAFWWGARAVGLFQDGIHGLKIMYKAGQVAQSGFILGITELATVAVEAGATVHNAIIEGMFYPIRSTLELMQHIPGSIGESATEALVQIQGLTEGFRATVPAALLEFRNEQRRTLAGTISELQGLMLEDLPSSVLMARIEGIMLEADSKIRERIEEIKKETLLKGGGDDEASKDQLRFEARIARLSEQWMTEQELLAQKFEKDNQLLNEGLEKNYLTEWEFFDKTAKLREQYNKKVEALDARKNNALFKGTVGILNNITSAMDGQSKKGFKIQQMAAIGQTTMATYESATQAYKAMAGIPVIGPALGAAAAAAAIAAGLANVRSIKKQKPGSSGGGSASVPSASAGAGSSAFSDQLSSIPTPQGNQNREVTPVNNYIFNGDINSNDPDKWIDDVRERLESGDKVLIPANSRNGQDLRNPG